MYLFRFKEGMDKVQLHGQLKLLENAKASIPIGMVCNPAIVEMMVEQMPMIDNYTPFSFINKVLWAVRAMDGTEFYIDRRMENFSIEVYFDEVELEMRLLNII